MIIYGKDYKVRAKKLIDDLAPIFNFTGLDDKKVKDQYFLRCPFHKNGQERTPSANFALKDHGRAKEGDFYCWGCHTSGHISSILTKLFGDQDKAQLWLDKHYTGKAIAPIAEVREARHIQIDLPTLPEEPTQAFTLKKEAYVEETDYWEKRGIRPETVKKFKLGYLPKRRAVYFPVFDRGGNVVFFQTRSIDSKEFYLPKGHSKILWNGNNIEGGEVVICESIFNALTVIQNGMQAVAIFGSGDHSTADQLLALPARSYILALDNDKSGRSGMQKLYRALKPSGRFISTVIIDEEGKDLNDYAHLSHDEFMVKWNKWLKRKGLLNG